MNNSANTISDETRGSLSEHMRTVERAGMEDRLGTAMSAKKNTSLGELIEHCSTTLAAQREINSRLASSLCRINGPFPTEHLGEDVERSKPSGDLELLRCLVNDLDQEQKRTMDMLEILSGV